MAAHFTTDLLNLEEPFQSAVLRKLGESTVKCSKNQVPEIIKQGKNFINLNVF
jgi:hypothetical protein